MKVHPVTVVVVNHNAGPLLARCLDDLVAQRVGTVFVVDNASEDGSWTAARREGITLVRSPVNLGFARAVNAALARSTLQTGDQSEGVDPYVLLLNADVVLDEGYVGRLVETLDREPTLAGVTGLLRLPEGVVDTSGIELTSARWASDRDRGGPTETASGDDPFGVSGAASLFRRSALDDVARGGEVLWDALFVYWEDVELAWRLRRAGWRLGLVTSATAEHQRGSDAAAPRFVEAANLRGRLSTVARHEGVSGLLRPQSVAVTLIVLLRLALRHPGALLEARPVRSVRAGLGARRLDARHGSSEAWATLPPDAFTDHAWRAWLVAQVTGLRRGFGSVGRAGRSRPPVRGARRLTRRREG